MRLMRREALYPGCRYIELVYTVKIIRISTNICGEFSVF